MRSGRLDRTITIQSFTESSDALGELVQTWSTFATRRAEYTPQRMDEAFEAARTVATRRVMFTIRWLDGLTEEMRIVFDDGSGSKNWNIRSVEQIGRKRGWRIIAEAIT